MKKILTGALAIMLFAVSAQAQTRDTIRHHKGGQEMMTKKLNLTEDQQSRLKSIHEAERSEMKSLKNSALTTDQQKAKKEELHKKYNEQVQSVYTPQQKEQIQKMKSERKENGKKGSKDGKKDKMSKDRKDGKGYNKGGDFAKELNLSPEQKEKMDKMRSTSKSQYEAVRSDKSLSEDQKKSKLQDLRKQQHQQMNTILTPEQIEKMKTLRKGRGQKATK